ncbi:MAG: deaminase [Aeromicrobium sp.]|nr:deaminase [Aeromicrobium sp.]
MAKLIYCAITSLDGFVEDAEGNFDWSMPDEEVHAFVNDLQRPVGTYLYGRRLYDVMVFWGTMPLDDASPVARDFAEVWRAADKIVYSTSLEAASTPNTRIERDFDPDTIRQMKATFERDLTVGGANLAGQAIEAGLVDEIHLLMSPILIGAGKPALPDARVELELIDERRFANGVVHLHHRVRI